MRSSASSVAGASFGEPGPGPPAAAGGPAAGGEAAFRSPGTTLTWPGHAVAASSAIRGATGIAGWVVKLSTRPDCTYTSREHAILPVPAASGWRAARSGPATGRPHLQPL